MAFSNLLRQHDNRLWFAVNGAARFAMARTPLAQTFGTLVINEFPKSGGTWLGQMLAQATGRVFPRNRLPVLQRSIMHGHTMSKAGLHRPVIVWRDGRDVMVSLYHHLISGHALSSSANRQRMRDILDAADPEDVTANMSRFIELSFDGQLYPAFNWAQFVDRWHGVGNGFETSYEALHENPVAVISSVIRHLGEPVPEEQILHDCIDNFDFAKQTGRKAGEEDARQFLRKGIVGDWRNVFDAQAREIFRQAAGKQLIALGYEEDDGWASGVGD